MPTFYPKLSGNDTNKLDLLNGDGSSRTVSDSVFDTYKFTVSNVDTSFAVIIVKNTNTDAGSVLYINEFVKSSTFDEAFILSPQIEGSTLPLIGSSTDNKVQATTATTGTGVTVAQSTDSSTGNCTGADGFFGYKIADKISSDGVGFNVASSDVCIPVYNVNTILTTGIPANSYAAFIVQFKPTQLTSVEEGVYIEINNSDALTRINLVGRAASPVNLHCKVGYALLEEDNVIFKATGGIIENGEILDLGYYPTTFAHSRTAKNIGADYSGNLHVDLNNYRGVFNSENPYVVYFDNHSQGGVFHYVDPNSGREEILDSPRITLLNDEETINNQTYTNLPTRLNNPSNDYIIDVKNKTVGATQTSFYNSWKHNYVDYRSTSMDLSKKGSANFMPINNPVELPNFGYRSIIEVQSSEGFYKIFNLSGQYNIDYDNGTASFTQFNEGATTYLSRPSILHNNNNSQVDVSQSPAYVMGLLLTHEISDFQNLQYFKVGPYSTTNDTRPIADRYFVFGVRSGVYSKVTCPRDFVDAIYGQLGKIHGFNYPLAPNYSLRPEDNGSGVWIGGSFPNSFTTQRFNTHYRYNNFNNTGSTDITYNINTIFKRGTEPIKARMQGKPSTEIDVAVQSYDTSATEDSSTEFVAFTSNHGDPVGMPVNQNYDLNSHGKAVMFRYLIRPFDILTYSDTRTATYMGYYSIELGPTRDVNNTDKVFTNNLAVDYKVGYNYQLAKSFIALNTHDDLDSELHSDNKVRLFYDDVPDSIPENGTREYSMRCKKEYINTTGVNSWYKYNSTDAFNPLTSQAMHSTDEGLWYGAGVGVIKKPKCWGNAANQNSNSYGEDYLYTRNEDGSFETVGQDYFIDPTGGNTDANNSKQANFYISLPSASYNTSTQKWRAVGRLFFHNTGHNDIAIQTIQIGDKNFDLANNGSAMYQTSNDPLMPGQNLTKIPVETNAGSGISNTPTWGLRNNPFAYSLDNSPQVLDWKVNNTSNVGMSDNVTRINTFPDATSETKIIEHYNLLNISNVNTTFNEADALYIIPHVKDDKLPINSGRAADFTKRSPTNHDHIDITFELDPTNNDLLDNGAYYTQIAISYFTSNYEDNYEVTSATAYDHRYVAGNTVNDKSRLYVSKFLLKCDVFANSTLEIQDSEGDGLSDNIDFGLLNI